MFDKYIWYSTRRNGHFADSLVQTIFIKMEKKDEIVNGDSSESEIKDGSICGYESLHRLLESSLSPQQFKVSFTLFFFIDSFEYI